MWATAWVSSLVPLGFVGLGAFAGFGLAALLLAPEAGVVVLILFHFVPTDQFAIGGLFAAFTALAAARAAFAYATRGANALYGLPLVPALAFFFWVVGWGAVGPERDVSETMHSAVLIGEAVLAMTATLLVCADQRATRYVVTAWVLAGAGALVIAASHYFIQDTALRAAAHALPQEALDSEVVNFFGRTGYDVRRIVWPGLTPNGHSANLAMPFAMAASLAVACWSDRRRILFALAAAACGVAILGTYSKTGLLIAVVTLVFVAVLHRGRSLPAAFAAAVPVALAVAYLPAVLAQARLIPEAAASGASGRFDAWRDATAMWLASPLVGAGPGAFINQSGMQVHNTYVELLAETGLVGLLLFLGVLLPSVRIPRTAATRAAAFGLFVTLLHMASISLTSYCLLWIGAGVLAAGAAQRAGGTGQPSREART
ncbi:MAG: O-antigen polymerase [Acidobacteria bacterium]|nr:O-antigen polymerase [Acidobacteriota bacterium]